MQAKEIPLLRLRVRLVGSPLDLRGFCQKTFTLDKPFWSGQNRLVPRQWSATTLSHSGEYFATGATQGQAFFASGYPGGSEVDIYNTSTGSWSTASLSQARYDAAGASGGNKLVFAGGGTAVHVGTNVVDIYNAQTNVWSTATLSQARGDMATLTVGEQMLFAGGDTQPYASTATNRVDIYNTTSGSWTTATLSKARDSLGVATANGYAFFAGGYVSGVGPTNIVDVYNSTAGTWSTMTLSSSRYSLLGASALDEVFFAAGYDKSNIWSSTVDIFNTTTGKWSTTSLPNTLSQASVAAAGNQVFFAGGYYRYPSNTTGYTSNLVDVYTIQSYPTITSSSVFALQDNTTVNGLMQLNGGSLSLGNFALAVGSMSGTAPIDLSSGTLTAGTDNTSKTYSGRVQGGGGLVKTGSGSLTLSSSNTYTGPTAAQSGRAPRQRLARQPGDRQQRRHAWRQRQPVERHGKFPRPPRTRRCAGTVVTEWEPFANLWGEDGLRTRYPAR